MATELASFAELKKAPIAGVPGARWLGTTPVIGKKEGRLAAPFDNRPSRPYQRLENWKRARAPARPYFLRSTTRLSRVRKPAAFMAPRRGGSNLVSACEMP